MQNLPIETKLDILKFLNFDHLCSVHQTNYYFNSLIDRYNGILPRKKFKYLSLVDRTEFFWHSFKLIKMESDVKTKKRWELPLQNRFTVFNEIIDGNEFMEKDNECLKKLRIAIKKKMPLYFCTEDMTTKDSIKNVAIRIVDFKSWFSGVVLNLPEYPKTIKEMEFIRYWLERLFLCFFEEAHFDYAIFNPEMIKLLFEKEENVQLQFNTTKALILFKNPILENYALKFIENHLSVKKLFRAEFDYSYRSEFSQYKGILLKLILNGGTKFPRISFTGSNIDLLPYKRFSTGSCRYLPIDSTFFELIINHIKNSQDCSNIVTYIGFPHVLLYKTDLKINYKNVGKKECKIEGELYTVEKHEVINSCYIKFYIFKLIKKYKFYGYVFIKNGYLKNEAFMGLKLANVRNQK
ncbi:F-box domain-containing protein [Meloidogyne graminicola]|uniref:F-box domain-containing protein n=1 Tax=Meloidogyne graminicola TaxID=189291 RepID=A0A8S9ZU82_9BILA|nr:F-box domain-containing protein [Meloidogyne graminicola]